MPIGLLLLLLLRKADASRNNACARRGVACRCSSGGARQADSRSARKQAACIVARSPQVTDRNVDEGRLHLV